MAKEATLNIPIRQVDAWTQRLHERAKKQRVVSSYTALMKTAADGIELCFAAGYDIDDILADAREAGIDEMQINRENLEKAYAQYRKKNPSTVKLAAPAAAPEAPAADAPAASAPEGASAQTSSPAAARPQRSATPTGDKAGKKGLEAANAMDRGQVAQI